MPGWLSQHLAEGVAANGTFTLKTDLGVSRVHPGNVVVQHRGAVWVRVHEDVDDFIEELKANVISGITNVGPGKVRQFGSARRTPIKVRNHGTGAVERKQKYAPPVGSLPSIEWIHLGRLTIDGAYQRSTNNEPSRRLIASIAAKFDWRLCAPLVISRRPDGTFTIIDGQHRWLAASKRDDIPQLPCCVFQYENMEEEARMFIVANRARKPMSRLDDYFAALAAADEDAIEIEQIVADAGFQIARTTSSTSWRPGEIAFTSSIANSIRRFGPVVTSAVLTNMAVAFKGQKLSHGATLFGALVKIMARPEPDFDPDRLVSALQTRTVIEWGAHISRLRGGSKERIGTLYDAIMEVYRQQPSTSDE
jgi:hypothetical protein